jgi:transposase
MIDVVEVSYRLVKVKQQKYVCRCGGCVETALGPARALSGSRYSRAFAIKVIVDKWLDHIPLERQVRIRERHGRHRDVANAVGSRVRILAATCDRRRGPRYTCGRRTCEPGIVLAGCWAHGYRSFDEAMPDHPDA